MEKFNIYPGSKDEQTEPKILVVTFILSPQVRYVDTRHKKNVHILQRECCKPDERSQRNKLITTYSNSQVKKKKMEFIVKIMILTSLQLSLQVK